MADGLQIGIVVFPRVTQLDFTGPLQVFSSVPGAKVHLIWKRIEPVASNSVMAITPTISFADCPQLDVICVPGGMGTDDMVNDEEMLAFLKKQAEGAKYVTSVCTGSLVLGAAGLLKGYRATTHWSADGSACAVRGDHPTKTRVCVDRNRVTGGGVTAGIDFALTLVSIMVDRQDRGGHPAAPRIQSRPALQRRLARDGAGGGARNAAGADGADPAAADGKLSPRRRATARAQLAPDPPQQRKRPPGCPDGLSCLTAAPH